MREEAFLISAVLATIGFCIYWFYGRPRVRRESALLHLIQRLTSRDLVTGTLESELKEIIRERDEIVADRFDELVDKCPILDLDGKMTRKTFFERAADALAEQMAISAEELQSLLTAREEQDSTVISPHLAIPHIVVEVAAQTQMLIARCRQGIHFSDDAPEVRAVIVLAGPRQERNFHLRCLTAIAQTVQAKDFETRWLAARGKQALRDLFLLADRRRG